MALARCMSPHVRPQKRRSDTSRASAYAWRIPNAWQSPTLRAAYEVCDNDTRFKTTIAAARVKAHRARLVKRPYVLMPPRSTRDWRITRWRPLARPRAAPCAHEFACRNHYMASMRAHSLRAIQLRRPCASALAYTRRQHTRDLLCRNNQAPLCPYLHALMGPSA